MKTLCICAAMMVAVIAVAQTPDPAPTSTAAAPALAGQARPTPADVMQKVKVALSEAGLSSNTLSVSTHAEAIVLTGQVGSAADATKAALAAQTAAGDFRLINEIQVTEAKPSPPAGTSGNTGK